MRKMKTMMVVVAIAASFTFTSCDDDSWYDGRWNDPYGWYDNYGGSNWGWDNGYWNGHQDASSSTLSDMASTLCGQWAGDMSYSYINDDGNSRTTERYYTDMKFFQYNNSNSSLSGDGVETDYLLDDSGNITDQSQALDFKWYIDDNGDIYIRYTKSGATFVLDYGSSQTGFHLGQESNKNVDTFYGYMIGTGNVKGDVIYFDFERQNSLSRSVSQSQNSENKSGSFGNGAVQRPLKATSSKFDGHR